MIHLLRFHIFCILLHMNKTENDMNLVDKLTSETQELKKAYINQIFDWASKEYERHEDRATWTEQQYCEFFGVEAVERNGRMTYPRGFHNTEHSRKHHKMFWETRKVVTDGRQKFVSNQVDKAIKHYENSILKLALRIQKKELNLSKITMKSSFLDPNMNTVITDGDKTVRAFTIIASGEVQKPHYRYLIK